MPRGWRLSGAAERVLAGSSRTLCRVPFVVRRVRWEETKKPRFLCSGPRPLERLVGLLFGSATQPTTSYGGAAGDRSRRSDTSSCGHLAGVGRLRQGRAVRLCRPVRLVRRGSGTAGFVGSRSDSALVVSPARWASDLIAKRRTPDETGWSSPRAGRDRCPEQVRPFRFALGVWEVDRGRDNLISMPVALARARSPESASRRRLHQGQGEV